MAYSEEHCVDQREAENPMEEVVADGYGGAGHDRAKSIVLRSKSLETFFDRTIAEVRTTIDDYARWLTSRVRVDHSHHAKGTAHNAPDSTPRRRAAVS